MIKEFNIFEAPLNGISLVEAGAGTGKTYNIASLFVRAIIENKLLPTDILVLTYTEAATAELKFRLRKRLKECISVLEGAKAADDFLKEFTVKYDHSHLEHLKNALYNFDEAPVSTIHGFCQRLLKENALEFGVSPEFEILTDDGILLQETIDQYWREFMSESMDEFTLGLQQLLIDEGITPDKLAQYIKPALGKKYAQIVPEIDLMHRFGSVYKNLNEVFKQIKASYSEESDEFKQVVKSGVLYKNTLNADTRYFLPDFTDWLDSDSLPVTPYLHIKYFSSYIYGKVTKGNEIPQFNFIGFVDQYLLLLEEFKKIKFSFIHHAIGIVSSAFEAEKKKREIQSYDDLLETVSKCLTPELAVLLRKKYPIALVDEFQDTDPVQYSIFKSIYKDSKDTAMFMIGDPKQAIYKFRGADIYTYLEARKDANYEYTLSFNFRSNLKIMEAVNNLFMKTENPFMLHDFDFNPARFPFSKDHKKEFLKCNGEDVSQMQILEYHPEEVSAGEIKTEIAESTASEIVNLLNSSYTIEDKSVVQSDIAVLVRTNSEAREMQNILRIRGIRSVIKGRESVFKTAESDELFIILKAITDISFENGIRAALSTEAIGYNAQKIIELLTNESKWNQLLERFYYYHKLWIERGFSSMVDQFIYEFQIELTLTEFFDAERRITNLYHLIELLKKAERDRKLSPHGLIRYFRNKRNDSSQNRDDEIIRLESDEKLVQIVTVHASKGLEYPIVFCPYLWKGIKFINEYPDIFNKEGTTYLDIGTQGELRNENRLISLKEDLAEDVRLAYVALTRAVSACFIHVIEGKDFELSSLSSLMEGEKILQGRIEAKINKKKLDASSFEMMSNIQELAHLTEIEFRTALKTTKTFQTKNEVNTLEFGTLEFKRKDISDYPKLTSFSALSVSAKSISIEEEKPGFDYDESDIKDLNIRSGQKNRFNLPKGANTGTMLHNIFEHIEFDDSASFDETIINELVRAGLGEEWFNTVKELITDSVNHKLAPDISLFEISSKDKIPEIEFHLPTSEISFTELVSIIRGSKALVHSETIQGFIKGYIDLTFRSGGKYFILDYKSNHLGDTFQDYGDQALKQEVLHSNYDLQYHLYVVALHRILKQSLPNYEYQKDFGGVFYLFLRGVNTEEKGSGVFFQKPDYDVIEALDHLFDGGAK